MPGAKRRALKKLLSPHHHHADSAPATSHGDSTPEAQELGYDAQQQPLSSSSAVVTSPISLPKAEAELENESAVLDEMEARSSMIGSGHSTQELVGSPPTSRGFHFGLHGSSSSAAAANGMHKSASAPPAITAEDLLNGNVGGTAAEAGGAAGGKKKKSSKQRFLEREARKKEERLAAAPQQDPQETERIEREKAEEERIINQTAAELKCTVKEIEPDGHCMYSAIADQLYVLGLTRSLDYRTARAAAADYLEANPDAFMPFLPSVMGEDMVGATDDGVMTPEGYKEYCRIVREGTNWGGEIEIQALSRAFKIPIHVIQRGPPSIISHSPDDVGSGGITVAESLQQGKAVRIVYYRRLFGLGEHYQSLRPIQ